MNIYQDKEANQMHQLAYAIKLDSIMWMTTGGQETLQFHQAGIILNREFALELYEGVKRKYPLARLLVV
jgi:hypothetical protein